jgi:hypothetical protein
VINLLRKNQLPKLSLFQKQNHKLKKHSPIKRM